MIDFANPQDPDIAPPGERAVPELGSEWAFAKKARFYPSRATCVGLCNTFGMGAGSTTLAGYGRKPVTARFAPWESDYYKLLKGQM
ncbi:hypothetical protein UC34_05715 [Pandoraea vervacti]|uniref:Uncharacterized protein n=1 Tax=Pandoraea vervacti TaxID=656178 RepID=A0ABM5SVU3_9BURK|nr:hypothetical protein UC34_05715 [Pandoraea vervacti]